MLTVNLFDDSFRHAICSSGWQTPQYIQYVRDRMEFDGITLFTDGYVNSPVVNEVKSRYKIGWLHEPECLHPENYSNALIWEHRRKFDFVLTYYKPFLEMPYPSNLMQKDFRFCPYGGIWVDRQDWGIKPKSKLCSLLSGDKLSTDGHRIRRAIADWPNTRIDLYGYKGQPVNYSPQTKLLALADYRFSIITETCRQDNLFTEWLLDCFIVGTVPIFWGCPNAGDFFDAEGILSFETLDECKTIIRNLSVNMYRAMGTAIWNNFNTAQQYAITEDWMYNNILKELV